MDHPIREDLHHRTHPLSHLNQGAGKAFLCHVGASRFGVPAPDGPNFAPYVRAALQSSPGHLENLT
jgi:hypothetical protein